jgi:hypothetical protein
MHNMIYKRITNDLVMISYLISMCDSLTNDNGIGDPRADLFDDIEVELLRLVKTNSMDSFTSTPQFKLCCLILNHPSYRFQRLPLPFDENGKANGVGLDQREDTDDDDPPSPAPSTLANVGTVNAARSAGTPKQGIRVNQSRDYVARSPSAATATITAVAGLHRSPSSDASPTRTSLRYIATATTSPVNSNRGGTHRYAITSMPSSSLPYATATGIGTIAR